MRINFWSSPRNISTALMYSFAQRSDTQVIDEPLYASYLYRTKKEHPGKEEILNAQSTDFKEVLDKVLLGQYSKPVKVFKQMSHHLEGLPFEFLHKMKNVLLIRAPEEIIFSYSKIIPDPKMEDIGVEFQYTLSKYLEANNKLDAVVDARELLLSPGSVLRKLCIKLDIEFDNKMLSWAPGPLKEDGVWAKYWYKNVHKSSGFQRYQKKVISLTDPQRKLAETCQPYYQYIFEKAITHHQ